jgi:methylated-DNA-protein-cysteine methyltransferase related protein
MGEYTVDLSKYGWFPDLLPSEAGEIESSDDDSDVEAREDAAAYHT